MKKGYVKVPVEEYKNLVIETAKLEAKVAELTRVRDGIVNLIDDEKFVCMEKLEIYEEPLLLKIKDVAKVLGLDWEEERRIWRELHKAHIDEVVNGGGF